MNTIEIPFQQLIAALLDEDTIFNHRYLYRLSDLEGQELAALEKDWPRVSVRRRQALMEDLEALNEIDYLLSYEAIIRLALQDEHPEVRLPAIRMLWEYEAPDLIPFFLQGCREDPDPGVRAGLAAALGKYVYLGELEEIPKRTLQEVEDHLIAIAMGDDEDPVRRCALESLGFSRRKEVSLLIEEAAGAADTAWLASALFAMGRSVDRRWAAQVVDHLEHREPLVRREAARAAGELELKDAAPALLELLDDVSDDVRAAAIWSLSQIGGTGVRERLEQLQESTNDEQEVDLLDEALDNLSFTEDFGSFDLFDFSEADLQEMLGEAEEADPE